jgi:transposase
MIGKKDRSQRSLLIPGTIEDFIPEDHILKRVDKVLNLSWLREEVESSYCEENGRPGIDPESAVRLMLAGFFHGIVHDRKLMREAQVNLAIRWFMGYGLTEKLPDHSSLTRIRQRWGVERFRRIFIKTVESCAAAGLVTLETIHADATLIRADVSWESLTTEYADASFESNIEDDVESSPKAKSGKRRSTTDPDATLTTSSKEYRMEPCYKQHSAVDDKAGVIVGVDVTTGEISEGGKLLEMIESVESATGRKVNCVTGDAGYAHSRNYEALEEKGVDAIIPPQNMGRARKGMHISRFKYDSHNDVVCCPAGKKLCRVSRAKNGWLYRAKQRDCQYCKFKSDCVPASSKTRTVLIVNGYPSLLRARRRRARWDDEYRIYNRHRFLVEGMHGEAKTQHGLRRAVRRGLDNVAIQVYLTAAVINLKRLAGRILRLLWFLFRVICRITTRTKPITADFTNCEGLFAQHAGAH